MPAAWGKAARPNRPDLRGIIADRRRALVATEGKLARTLYKVYLDFYKGFLVSPGLRISDSLRERFTRGMTAALGAGLKAPAALSLKISRRMVSQLRRGKAFPGGRKIVVSPGVIETSGEESFLVRFVFPAIEERIARVASQMLNTQVNYLQGLLTRAAQEGLSMQQIAQELTLTLIPPAGFRGPPAAYARTVARTEVFAAYEQGSREAFSALGVQEVEWLVVDDDLLCEQCAPMQGRRMSNSAPLEDRPPLHPNCRCTTVPVE